MSGSIMPVPFATGKSRRGGTFGGMFHPAFPRRPLPMQVLVRIEARVLATSTPCFATTIPLCLVAYPRATSPLALTFTHRAYRVTAVHVLQDRVRLERTEYLKRSLRFATWVEIPIRAWHRLFAKAGMLPTALLGIVCGPEPMPLPPAPPAPPLAYPFRLDG